jgi:hypothetical protein
MSHSDYKNLYEGYLDNTGYNNRNIRENYAVGFTQCSGYGYYGDLYRSSNIDRCNKANNVSNCAYDSTCGVIPLFNKELKFQIQINNNAPTQINDNTLSIEAYVGDIVSFTTGVFNKYETSKDGISKTNYSVKNDTVYDYINVNTGGFGVFEVINQIPFGISRGSLIETGSPHIVSNTPQYHGTWSGQISRPPNSKKPSATGKAGVKTTWIYMFTIKLNYTDPKGVNIFQEKKIQFTILERY